MKRTLLFLLALLVLAGTLSCGKEVKGLKEELKILKEENSFLKAENIVLKKELDQVYKKLEEKDIKVSGWTGMTRETGDIPAKPATGGKGDAKAREGKKEKPQ